MSTVSPAGLNERVNFTCDTACAPDFVRAFFNACLLLPQRIFVTSTLHSPTALKSLTRLVSETSTIVRTAEQILRPKNSMEFVSKKRKAIGEFSPGASTVKTVGSRRAACSLPRRDDLDTNRATEGRILTIWYRPTHLHYDTRRSSPVGLQHCGAARSHLRLPAPNKHLPDPTSPSAVPRYDRDFGDDTAEALPEILRSERVMDDTQTRSSRWPNRSRGRQDCACRVHCNCRFHFTRHARRDLSGRLLPATL